MFKPALCIKKEDHVKPLTQWETQLIDRSICEYDHSTLQIIPYIVLMNEEDDTVFSYLRGPGGNESRLHTKTSIGLGGHIDIESNGDLIETIVEEVVRELVEEIAYHLKPEEIESIRQKLKREQYVKIYHETSDNPVDLVHIGLAIVVVINKECLVSLEENVINNPQWLTIEQLRNNSLTGNKDLNLENWSLTVVDTVF